MDMNYRVIDKEKYYRSGVFRHFTEDCKCSTSKRTGEGSRYAVWIGQI